MGKIVGVKILVNNAWIMVWMPEQEVRELTDRYKSTHSDTKITVGGICSLTGITWLVRLSEVAAIHTITDFDTQQAQQQMAQASQQIPPRPPASPFRASGR